MRTAAHHPRTRGRIVLAAAVALAQSLDAEDLAPAALTADDALAAYFRAETRRLTDRSLSGFTTLPEWKAQRPTLRQQLLDMLGLDPLPARGDLHASVTGSVDQETFRVDKVVFQSLPGLYVTGNLYIPKGLTGPAATVLYLCGHGPSIADGVSCGNKVTYQHHGIWLAQHGYAALLIDTLQLGEIQGLHHGTYREAQWWWSSRGYTPAGVEAWNAVRALDYLETRAEVDRSRIGVTGRSGGGAYSWWIAAIDDRVRVAAPVAGITDLDDHVVRGCVEGHCDCMYLVNTFRWDYPQVAALVAPRPLLVVNTDDDAIFPLGGVTRTYEKVRRIYELHGARDKLGLAIGPGPHKDTQDLQVPVLRWLDKHLRGVERPIESAAKKLFEPKALKVLAALPGDQINTSIQERFVGAALPPEPPASREAWEAARSRWHDGLRNRAFAGWPEPPPALDLDRRRVEAHGGAELSTTELTSQEHVRLQLTMLRRPVALGTANRVVLHVSAELPAWAGAAAPLAAQVSRDLAGGAVLAHVAPRGLGPAAWSGDARKQTHIRRRFLLLGQTLDGMRVWDIRRAIAALRSTDGLERAPLRLVAAGDQACNALHAALFESTAGMPVDLELEGLAESYVKGPDYLNVLKHLDVPQAVAMAAEHGSIVLRQADSPRWDFVRQTAARLGWPGGRFTVECPPALKPEAGGGRIE